MPVVFTSKEFQMHLIKIKTGGPNGRKRIYFCGIRIYKSKKKKSPVIAPESVQVSQQPQKTVTTQDAPTPPKATIKDFGQNNQINIANPDNANLRISVWGDNNIVEIKSKAGRFNTRIEIGSPNSRCNGAKVIVEDKVTINGLYMLLMENNSSIHIGQDCTISNDVLIWCTDTHYITDMDGNLINVGTSVEIGNHCWIGYGVRILKNTRIPNNCIVGMASVVTKKFDTENAVYAGNPAKLVKSNVQWGRMRPQEYMDKNSK